MTDELFSRENYKMIYLIWKPAADSEFVILSISFIGKWLWLTANNANPKTMLSHADNLTRWQQPRQCAT